MTEPVLVVTCNQCGANTGASLIGVKSSVEFVGQMVIDAGVMGRSIQFVSEGVRISSCKCAALAKAKEPA